MSDPKKFSPDLILVRLHEVINDPDAFLYRLILGILAGRMSLVRRTHEEDSSPPRKPTILYEPFASLGNQKIIDVGKIAQAGKSNKSIFIPGWGNTLVAQPKDDKLHLRDWKAACRMYRLMDCESITPASYWFDFDTLMTNLLSLSYDSFSAYDLFSQDILCQHCMLLACGGCFSRMVHVSYQSIDSAHTEPYVHQWSQAQLITFLQQQTLAGYETSSVLPGFQLDYQSYQTAEQPLITKHPFYIAENEKVIKEPRREISH